jgi:ActR/RegA family two-component response regulator
VTVARSCAEAFKILKLRRFDYAVLDIKLQDGCCYDVADALRQLGTGFVFMTGYEEARQDFADIPVLQKPFDLEVLPDALLSTAPSLGDATGKKPPRAVRET